MEKKSPFEPRKPVSPDRLIGREDVINDYIKFMPQQLMVNRNISIYMVIEEQVNLHWQII